MQKLPGSVMDSRYDFLSAIYSPISTAALLKLFGPSQKLLRPILSILIAYNEVGVINEAYRYGGFCHIVENISSDKMKMASIPELSSIKVGTYFPLSLTVYWLGFGISLSSYAQTARFLILLLHKLPRTNFEKSQKVTTIYQRIIPAMRSSTTPSRFERSNHSRDRIYTQYEGRANALIAMRSFMRVRIWAFASLLRFHDECHIEWTYR